MKGANDHEEKYEKRKRHDEKTVSPERPGSDPTVESRILQVNCEDKGGTTMMRRKAIRAEKPSDIEFARQTELERLILGCKGF